MNFASIFDLFGILFEKEGKSKSEDTELNVVMLHDFTSWFEKQLTNLAIFDLQDIVGVLLKLDENTSSLKKLATEYKSSSAFISVVQNSKSQKLCDQIDSLVIFLNQKSNSIGIQDFEFLRENLSKNKVRLKLIDDLSAPKKADAGKGKKGNSGTNVSTSRNTNDSAKKNAEINSIRLEVKNGLALLEEMESVLLQKSFVVDYFAEIRSRVFKPIHDSISKQQQLPPLSDLEKHLAAEVDAHKRVDGMYESAKNVEILIKTAKLKFEAEQIGKVTLELLTPIKTSVTGSRLEALQSAVGAKKAWLTTLQHVMCKLALFDLLSLGSNESVRNSFLLAIKELQKWVSGQTAVGINSFDEPLRESIRDLDVELLLALLEDGSERVTLFNSVSRSEEFAKCYRQLTVARSAAAKARSNCDKAMAALQAARDQHQQAALQAQQLKERLSEIAWAELGQRVVVE